MAEEDRIAGALLGTALGDALGLAAEGMSARSIARRFGRVERFHLLGRTGFVSDDTEQSALVAQSLARHPDDVERCVRAFRRSLLGWFARLPWGVGLGTVRACVRIGLGMRPSGVMSAGNGAAMRAAVVGCFFDARPIERERFGRALAEVTHRDPRAVEGALYVAELAAACADLPPGTPAEACQERARRIVTVPALGEALDRARDLALRGASTAEAAAACGTSGFVVHSVPFATFGLLRHGSDPLHALAEVIGAGGDTDSNAAILGAWLGALHGASALPAALIGAIHDGPFGPTHLRALARSLARIRGGEPTPAPDYSPALALARNLALYPVVIGHGLRRIVPF
ncbi:ADP-ribosyl-[dinitrogen reductase] glycohydrolase [Aquisphaera giovannonii]|uniref:ADP-ribosyl-[dinitrogen reductase] glycohydrolase n=1 Tax=Aquisphaera giovannonii TaxID=406548 RepID=A0A5B9W7F7_9BACT|nr:ADP-ribosylglycohydrolase family protein [Aquisphaera giovannonii]QEH35951.1 ADP-ribosyl-[dinitrogen reductase] glycohydrolase [Aquisphaera giovannonii]